jgi:2-C-methyl-D-erythritol 2,4-cyclodiphosphate synthase
MPSRIGLGFDVHRLVPGKGFRLGGVEVPSEVKCEGHSDADPLLHALVDALLGATARGDIGEHFPDTEAKWKGADSRIFVEKAVRIVSEAGFTIGNVDATVFLERPRLGPLKVEICRVIAGLLGIDAGKVSVKAKTLEGLGSIGTSQAVAAQVGVALHERPGDPP